MYEHIIESGHRPHFPFLKNFPLVLVAVLACCRLFAVARLLLLACCCTKYLLLLNAPPVNHVYLRVFVKFSEIKWEEWCGRITQLSLFQKTFPSCWWLLLVCCCSLVAARLLLLGCCCTKYLLLLNRVSSRSLFSKFLNKFKIIKILPNFQNFARFQKTHFCSFKNIWKVRSTAFEPCKTLGGASYDRNGSKKWFLFSCLVRVDTGALLQAF